MRQFWENLAQYLNSTEPIAVMRHGQTAGYFFPTHQEPAMAKIVSRKSSILCCK
jgi:hypothetical protein